MTQNTSRLQTALSSGTTVITRPNTTQQVLAILSPQKTVTTIGQQVVSVNILGLCVFVSMTVDYSMLSYLPSGFYHLLQPITAKVIAHPAQQAFTSPKFNIDGSTTGANITLNTLEAATVKKEAPSIAVDDSKQRKPCNCTKSHCLKL